MSVNYSATLIDGVMTFDFGVNDADSELVKMIIENVDLTMKMSKATSLRIVSHGKITFKRNGKLETRKICL